MNETIITVTGNLVDDPQLRTLPSGDHLASFRIASTSRRWDRETGGYVDNKTLYLTVSCWGRTALNAKQSLHKGQPVVVNGSIYTNDYIKDEQRRTSYEMRAFSLGHDLARGWTKFEKVTAGGPVTSVPVDDDGIPLDLSGEMFGDDLGDEPMYDLGPAADGVSRLVGSESLVPAG